MYMGTVIGKHTVNGVPNFTVPMMTFAGFGVAAVLFAVALKILNSRNHYHLEEPNIQK